MTAQNSIIRIIRIISKLKPNFHRLSLGYGDLRRFLRRSFPIALIVILLLAPAVYFLSRFPKSATAGWFNDSWGYRQKVEITNSGSAQTDFQVAITLDTSTLITATKMQSDCDDIRITDISGKLLPLWIEPTTCNTTTTKVWTKVPTIGTTGNTVYMYYGNPQAASISSTTLTFIREVPNLEGYWDYSITASYPGSGTIWSDLSGNSRTMTYSGASPTWSAANGFTFDGTAYFTGPSSSVFPQGTNARSVVALAKQTSIVGSYNHVFHYGTQSQYQAFGITSNGGTISTHTWSSQHAVGSWDLNTEQRVVTTGTGSTQEIYKNGVSQGIGTAYALNTGGGSASQIGTRIGPAEGWQGTIKYVQIYSRVLTSSEVSDLANNRPYATSTYSGKSLVRKNATTEPTIASPVNEEKSPGPVAYWAFDEGYGTVAQDKTANNNDGTLAASPATPTWQTEDMCVNGKCLRFDGSDDYVNAGNGASLNITGAITVEAWIKMNVLPSATGFGVVSKRATNTNYELGITQSAPAGRMFNYDGATVRFSNTAIPANEWHHVAMTISSNVVTFYLDGKNDGSAASTMGTTHTGSLFVGKGQLTSEYFNGSIDEPKIYNYARSAEQIKTDYLARGAAKGVSAKIGDESAWLSKGLVGYWKMDEASWTVDCATTSVTDSSGNGNNGKSCPTTTGPAGGAAGKFGNAGSFDGSNDYVDAASSSFMNGASSGSFVVWINPTSIGGGAYSSVRNIIIGKASNPDDALGFSDTTNKIRLRLGNVTNLDSTSTITTGVWTHVAATWDANGMKIYINGVLDNSNSTAATWYSSSYNTLIGRMYTGSTSGSFTGSLDDVRIYKRALSPSEVERLYNWAPGPKSNLNMDEGSGTQANDSSGNNNYGTLNNSTWSQGKYGKGVKLDGTNGNNVSVGDFAY